MNNNLNNTIIKIDQLLSEKKYDELSDIFTDDYLQEINCDELAYIGLYVLVYREEKSNGIPNVSLNLGNNTDELIYIFRKLKFLLWNYEFDKNTETTKSLVDYIVSNSISAEFLKTVISTSTVDKTRILHELSLIFS